MKGYVNLYTSRQNPNTTPVYYVFVKENHAIQHSKPFESDGHWNIERLGYVDLVFPRRSRVKYRDFETRN